MNTRSNKGVRYFYDAAHIIDENNLPVRYFIYDRRNPGISMATAYQASDAELICDSLNHLWPVSDDKHQD